MGNGMHSQTWDQARAARILCAVTFHFVASRLPFLAEALRALAEYPVAALQVVIVTNTAHPSELGVLERLCGELSPEGRFSIRSYADLANPWELPWRHKAIIANEFFKENDGRFTHFIYLEGDIRLSFVNFAYFVEFRGLLRNFGLLPAFIRLEYNNVEAGLTTSDVFFPVFVPLQPNIVLDGFVMVNLPNPYNPCFILDAELAVEYLQSRSFEQDKSVQVCNWGRAERAAMGLCLERVPAPFQSRYVVAVDRQTGAAPAFACIWHMPNNYANNPHSPLGKVRMDRLFRGASEISSDRTWLPVDPEELSISGRFPETGMERETNASTLVEGEATESVQQYYLVSAHDTILFSADDGRRVAHAPLGIAPLNLLFEVEGRRGRLLIKGNATSGVRQISFGRSPEEITITTGRADLDWEVEFFSDESVGIRCHGLYLAADWDSVARRNRQWCRDWEKYAVVRADTLDGIDLLRRYSWVCHGDGRVISLAAQPIDFGRMRPAESSALAATFAPGSHEAARLVVFGPARFQLVGRRQTFFVSGTEQGVDTDHIRVRIRSVDGLDHEFSPVPR